MSVIWAPVEAYEDDNLTASQVEAEQADDEAFKAQPFKKCEHIWERIDLRVWQCELCGQMEDFSEGWE